MVTGSATSTPVVSVEPISKISASSSISALLPVKVAEVAEPCSGLVGRQPLWFKAMESLPFQRLDDIRRRRLQKTNVEEVEAIARFSPTPRRGAFAGGRRERQMISHVPREPRLFQLLKRASMVAFAPSQPGASLRIISAVRAEQRRGTASEGGASGTSLDFARAERRGFGPQGMPRRGHASAASSAVASASTSSAVVVSVTATTRPFCNAASPG